MSNATQSLASIYPGIAPNITSFSQCTPALCSVKLYGTLAYVPSHTGNVFFLCIFLLLLFGQIGWCFVRRTPTFTFAMISGIFLEILGYIARTWMHKAIFNKNPFIMNLVCLTIAPVFFTAALYITLGRVIVHYGPQHSRLTPRMYSLIFMTSDVIALLLQSVGGAIADNASTDSGETFGTNIMVAGLASQLISLSCFLILASEFFWKVSVDRKARNATNWASKSIDRPPPDKEFFKLFLVGYGCATLLILARSIFRTAELAHGFRGSLANNELAFMVLEGGMIIFATLTMTILHPAEFIGEKWKESGWGINKNDQPAGEMRKASLDEDAHELREDVYMRPWPAPVGPLGPISAPIPIPNYVPETMPDRF